MSGFVEPSSAATASARTHSRLKTSYFVLEGLNAVASAYYFNYLFFYLAEHFGFGNRKNLLVTALYGFVYMISAWYAGRIARKHGYFQLLRIGFSGMALAMALGGLIPLAFGYSASAQAAEFVILVLWTASMCLTWPTLQALVSRGQSPAELPRTAGIYNIVWASASAFSYFTGGALLDWLGGEALIFWLPLVIHTVQLALLDRLKRLHDSAPPPEPSGASAAVPGLNPRPIAKVRSFLTLAWIANPFAYVAIYGILPVIPKLSERLGLTTTFAGLVCSVWFWARMAAFVWFWRWTGWHYRFRWLFTAFVATIAGFAAILLSSQVWTLILAQVVFGLAVGLIYYSSLYYSMDTGASKGKQGGIHEAAIGMGIFLGPTVGVAALKIFPGHPNAGTYNISGLLILGLITFLAVRIRLRAAPG